MKTEKVTQVLLKIFIAFLVALAIFGLYVCVDNVFELGRLLNNR